jgi:hypothetical protein
VGGAVRHGDGIRAKKTPNSFLSGRLDTLTTTFFDMSSSRGALHRSALVEF